MMHTINVKYLLPVFMLALVVAPLYQTPTLKDWEDALAASKSGKGCESIPYSAFRSKCMSHSAKVETACKTAGWSCDGLGTKNLKATMAALSGHITRLEEQKKQLESQKTRAGSATEKADLTKKIADVDKQISEKTRTLNNSETKLKNDLVNIEARLDKGRECLKARNDVQGEFKNAGTEAGRVRVPHIKVIADSLIEYWEDKAEAHQTALKNVELGITKCESSRDGKL